MTSDLLPAVVPTKYWHRLEDGRVQCDLCPRYCKLHVLDALIYLRHHTDVWFEITTLLIPGLNDSEAELEAMTRWVVDNLGLDVPLHFTAFHPDYRMRDRPPTPPETLRQARAIARKNGVRYAYVGNVHDPEGDSTYCPHCGAQLIGRDWYRLTAWNLDPDGRCPSCAAACAGVFEARPGDGGPRRLAGRLSCWAGS